MFSMDEDVSHIVIVIKEDGVPCFISIRFPEVTPRSITFSCPFTLLIRDFGKLLYICIEPNGMPLSVTHSATKS